MNAYSSFMSGGGLRAAAVKKQAVSFLWRVPRAALFFVHALIRKSARKAFLAQAVFIICSTVSVPPRRRIFP